MVGGHALDGILHIGGAEPDRASDFDVGNESGHAPAIEVAFADVEQGAYFLLFHQRYASRLDEE